MTTQLPEGKKNPPVLVPYQEGAEGGLDADGGPFLADRPEIFGRSTDDRGDSGSEAVGVE